MATMNDALRVLAQHPGGVLSGAVADALWPDGSQGRRREGGEYKTWNKPHHGGPTGGQRAAAGLLGRMARRGLVTKDWRHDDPRSWWRLSSEGYAALAALKTPNDGAEARPAHTEAQR